MCIFSQIFLWLIVDKVSEGRQGGMGEGQVLLHE